MASLNIYVKDSKKKREGVDNEITERRNQLNGPVKALGRFETNRVRSNRHELRF